MSLSQMAHAEDTAPGFTANAHLLAANTESSKHARHLVRRQRGIMRVSGAPVKGDQSWHRKFDIS
jgi:hypothetical protein